MKKHTIKRYSKTIVLLAGITLMGAGCGAENSTATAISSPAPAPLSVQVYTVKLGPIENRVDLSGRARAYQEAEIRPEVSGIIVDRLFEEGQSVTKGTALYKIDSARYAAEVESAKAGLERAKSASKLADETLARFERLASIRAVSQQEYEQALAAANQAKADIDIQRAAVDRTTIDFKKTTLRAPISGQIGVSSVTTGALVTANQSQALARILQLDPINVDMAVPSVRVVDFNRKIKSGEIEVDSKNEAEVDIIMEDGQPYEFVGKIAFREFSVDENAGSITLRTTVPNPHGTLLPGMFLRSRMSAGRFEAAATVPQEAVTRSARGEVAVFVANADNIVERKNITTVGNLGNSWIVTEGLATGDKIITSNLQGIREGMVVTPVSEVEGQ